MNAEMTRTLHNIKIDLRKVYFKAIKCDCEATRVSTNFGSLITCTKCEVCRELFVKVSSQNVMPLKGNKKVIVQSQCQFGEEVIDNTLLNKTDD